MWDRGRSDLEPCSPSKTFTTLCEEVHSLYHLDSCFRVDFWVAQFQKTVCRWIIHG